MARTEPITRLEVAACPTHRMDVKHYAPYEVGCACLTDDRRASWPPGSPRRAPRATPWPRWPSDSRPRPCSARTSPPWWPDPMPGSRTPTSAPTAADPPRLYVRRSLAEHLDTDEILEVTRQGLAFFEEAFGQPYPFEKYDQLFVPEFSPARWRTRAASPSASPTSSARRSPTRARAPRRDDPARDGPHVVRRPRDDALVGRPVAQRVVRHLHVPALARPGHPVHARLGDVPRSREGLGQAPGPAALDPPGRRRHARHRVRAPELRRDHLRQGRLGAAPAGRLGRPGRVPGRVPRYFAEHAWDNTTLADFLGALEQASGRDLGGLARRVARDHRGQRARRADGGLVRREQTEIDVEGPTTRIDTWRDEGPGQRC
jgi:hypothetical protein